ncbi:hypothetical protein HK096_009919, partial [Nowakowskiella sp. JEL0078]
SNYESQNVIIPDTFKANKKKVILGKYQNSGALLAQTFDSSNTSLVVSYFVAELYSLEKWNSLDFFEQLEYSCLYNAYTSDYSTNSISEQTLQNNAFDKTFGILKNGQDDERSFSRPSPESTLCKTAVYYFPQSSPLSNANSISPELSNVSPTMPAEIFNFSKDNFSMLPILTSQEQHIFYLSSLGTDTSIQSFTMPTNIFAEIPFKQQSRKYQFQADMISHGTLANTTEESAQPNSNTSSADPSIELSNKAPQTSSKTSNLYWGSVLSETSNKRASSDSEHDNMNYATIKRQRNTEAARRSRQRKVENTEILEVRVKELENENSTLSVHSAVLENEKLAWIAKERELLQRIKRLEDQLLE